MVHSVSLQATHIVVFASLRLSNIIKNVDSKDIALGFKGSLGNKGGCSIEMTVGDTKMCFISCHLHSGQNVIEKRNKDFNEVV